MTDRETLRAGAIARFEAGARTAANACRIASPSVPSRSFCSAATHDTGSCWAVVAAIDRNAIDRAQPTDPVAVDAIKSATPSCAARFVSRSSSSAC